MGNYQQTKYGIKQALLPAVAALGILFGGLEARAQETPYFWGSIGSEKAGATEYARLQMQWENEALMKRVAKENSEKNRAFAEPQVTRIEIRTVEVQAPAPVEPALTLEQQLVNYRGESTKQWISLQESTLEIMRSYKVMVDKDQYDERAHQKCIVYTKGQKKSYEMLVVLKRILQNLDNGHYDFNQEPINKYLSEVDGLLKTADIINEDIVKRYVPKISKSEESK